jgi:hypothetical protein
MTTATGASFVRAADLLAMHLTDHQLPLPASLAVLTKEDGHSELTVQLRSDTLPDLEVFGGVGYHPTLFADLAPDERRTATLAHLRTWASSTSTHTDTPLLDLHWGQR